MGVTATCDPIARVCLNNRTFRDRGAYLRVGIWPANMYDNSDMATPHNGALVCTGTAGGSKDKCIELGK